MDVGVVYELLWWCLDQKHWVSRPRTCSSVVLASRINSSVLSEQILVWCSGTEPRSWRSKTERRRAARVARSGVRHLRVGRSSAERHRAETGITEPHRAGWSGTGSMEHHKIWMEHGRKRAARILAERQQVSQMWWCAMAVAVFRDGFR